jgi:ribosome maturation factor RimP
MITAELIHSILEEILDDTDFFVVEVKVAPGNKIAVELDTHAGILISQCAQISRKIEQKLDRDQEDFELQVSSPGLEKPLRHYKQYLKNIGRKVSVNTADFSKEGLLQAVEEDKILLATEEKELVEGKKSKQKVQKIIPILFNQIKETKVKITFN